VERKREAWNLLADAVGAYMVGTVRGQTVGTDVVSAVSSLAVGAYVVSAVRGQTIGTDVVSAVRGQTVGTDVISAISGLAISAYVVSAVRGQTVGTDMVSAIRSLTIRTGVRGIRVRRTAFRNNSAVQYCRVIGNRQSKCARCQDRETKTKNKI
jgi:GNAT superfamily N-acetyltransferase